MEPWFAAPLTLLILGLGVYCHRNWLAILPEDPPRTGRRRHRVPTPMAGFLPAVVACIGWLRFEVSPWVIAALVAAATTGYLDDRGKARGEEMRWQTKAVALGGSAGLLVVAAALRFDLGPVQGLIALVWVFAVVNATNFMDNTDGVSASLGALGLLLVSQGEGAMAWAGFAFLGFVPANWPRPVVFLGDSGSLSLGICLAWATLEFGAATPRTASPTWPITVAAVLPVAIFAIDFVQVILARLILGLPPWLGDRRHLTHIATNLGLPRVLVAPVFVGLGFLLWRIG